MSDPARYDGSRPEPPYNTDTDAVVMIQEELDEMTGDRDLFAKALAAMTADRDALRAELDRTKGEMERVRRRLMESLVGTSVVSDLSDPKTSDRIIRGLDACRAALERKADA